MFKKSANLQIFLTLGAVTLMTVIICLCAISCSGDSITFEKSYYFVCYRTGDNAVSASSLSQTASSYGGAGYILQFNDDYYVTISCYYTSDEAEAVCSNLKKKDLDCTVLQADVKKIKLQSKYARNNKELYLGNLNTLNTLSNIAYDCANGLDTGKYSQSEAKRILSSIKDGLNGLLKANGNNCFTQPLQDIIAECENAEYGYLFSKDMRYIQIAVADKIINAKLY